MMVRSEIVLLQHNVIPILDEINLDGCMLMSICENRKDIHLLESCIRCRH